MKEKKQKVLVGMSGGVDSSVSAALLLEQGYEVIGAFMKNWSSDAENELQNECNWRDERRDAMRVAAQLDIPFLTFDFEKEYRRDVIDYMFREFEAGRTPNPDVMCNKYVKFDLFVKEAEKLGCDFIATGHYARREDGKILAGKDKNKDQTYFLWAINPTVLPRVLFPIGDMDKPDVRVKAESLELDVAEKKDSVGICFVGEVNIAEFLKTRVKEEPGDIITTEGKVIGQHRGVNFYTIGQRHGLDVGGGTPYYVVAKRPKKRELVVSSNYHQGLYKKDLVAIQCNWFRIPESKFRCEARIRYRQDLQKCKVMMTDDGNVRVEFKEPQRAVTPGQSIVFYDGEEMIGGGIIE